LALRPWPSKVAVGVGALRAEPGASGLAAALGDKGAQRAYPAASSGDDSTNRPEDSDMMQWAVIFLVIAILAGLFGLSGIAGAATNIAWILFLVGLILAAIFYFRGRSTTL
jgi:uncharacterized membrane protein YtjA (UPF0391 family)